MSKQPDDLEGPLEVFKAVNSILRIGTEENIRADTGDIRAPTAASNAKCGAISVGYVV